ncbi:MAG: DAK2 domain-containing protein [Oscillospiraceae bacterium]|nr:DAK2 domain-containing protein [Oscillospiraceae bacterium]
MSTSVIDGAVFARMLRGGAAVLAEHVEELNALNVFPVSDGDTGTNMMRTVEGGLCEIGREPLCDSIGTTAKRFADGALLGARGNSGVILSQIFAGIAEGLAGLESADPGEIASAWRRGIGTAYAAVQEPAEGTILTVFRESTEYAAGKRGECAGAEDFFRFHAEKAESSLAMTKEILPALKEADVVDSGAAGYLYLVLGMYEVLCGKRIDAPRPAPNSENKPEESVHIERFTRDTALEYGYCTEFLLRLTSSKTDPDAFEIRTVTDALAELGGESVVATKQGDIVKVHVHTFTPGRILDKAQAWGEFLTVKVENMMLGHTETAPRPKAKARNARPWSVVAAASGDGIARLFSELGADEVLREESPSTEDFLKACRRCGTRDILVLPDHKNSFLAARQAAKLLPEKKIRVIETKNDVQGYSALSVLTPGIEDMDVLENSARRAAESVADGEVTRAVRDAEVGGFSVHRGDWLAKCRGTLAAVAGTPEEAVLRLLETCDAENCELLTLFTGKDIDPEKCAALEKRLAEFCPELEITVYDGGQEIYDYYLALE